MSMNMCAKAAASYATDSVFKVHVLESVFACVWCV